MKNIIICALFTGLFLSAMPYSRAKNSTQKANYYLTQASTYYNQENYPQAEKAFRQLLKMKVSLHKDFYYFYGKTLYHNGKFEKAAANLRSYTETVSKKGRYQTDAKRLLKRAEKQLVQKQPQKTKKKKPVLKFPNIPEMMIIPVGSFVMGSSHGSADQKPPHKVVIKKSFAIGKYEVTFAQYDVFAKATSRKKPDDSGWGRGNRPVINVSLYSANEYARWLTKKTNRRFRLPTELEWEYVARTGFKNQLGFNDLLGLGDANCDGCRYFWESAKTVEVGSFDANKYGVHDLFGNVWEWTCSIYTRGYNGQEEHCANENDLEGKTMAVRGGSWNSFSQILRSYIRFNNFPTYRGNEQGFRLVEELE
ncbi:MAG: SUMF1/EgtB/PvdO family nonheme iron enzyme [Gammaproteobacteria bacterium]|nr:SUMF1/EgtB/PvdO family nonheme iron enzyme [Gammaproteobacteria bacterium]